MYSSRIDIPSGRHAGCWVIVSLSTVRKASLKVGVLSGLFGKTTVVHEVRIRQRAMSMDFKNVSRLPRYFVRKPVLWTA
jgi:hypothetical protein